MSEEAKKQRDEHKRDLAQKFNALVAEHFPPNKVDIMLVVEAVFVTLVAYLKRLPMSPRIAMYDDLVKRFRILLLMEK